MNMNLVEAVNVALGTNGTNLQGALNEAAGVDASNITEAISNIEGGGGGGVVVPEVTLTFTSETGGTYTSTVPFQEMVDLISNTPWGDDEVGKIYPFLLKRVLGATVSLGDFFTALCFEDTISIYTATSTVTLNEDGTYTEN